MHQTRYKSLYQLLGFSITISITFPCFLCSTRDESYYANCKQAFKCGDPNVLGDLKFPFWGINRGRHCGDPGFELKCINNTPLIANSTYNLEVISTNTQFRKITVELADFRNNLCPSLVLNKHRTNVSFLNPISGSLFMVSGIRFLTILYGCPSELGHQLSWSEEYSCSTKNTAAGVHYVTDTVNASLTSNCTSVVSLPIQQQTVESLDNKAISLNDILDQGFEMKYFMPEGNYCDSCTGSGGQCGYDWTANQFTCYCPDNKTYSRACPPFEQGHSGTKIIIGVSIGAAVLIALLGGCLILARKKRNQLIAQQKTRGIFPTPDSSSNGGPNVPTPGSNGLTSSQAYTSTPTTYSQSMASYASSTSDFGRQKTNYFGVHVFDYAVLEHITCNFHESKELGDGGFGTVYYGVLPDGRQVAVKRLYENSLKRVEQFMNEIQILASIQHKNLVALYGCTSRSSRELLLVYEYIPNGTVADHLHGKFAETTFLKWPTRLSIAVETAEALAFLHRRDVIHRDVKTANVLLDNDFHVKVADFGLSRLFPTDMTHVSTAPQGTPGYVDPEYYQCYRLTEKSDVYSFGVVLSELISSKHAVDITRHRHDVNLANMAVDRIQNKALEDLVDPRLGFDKDHDVQAMVKMVAELAFRCLQQDRDMRPTMAEVVASLRAIQLEGIKEQKQEVLDIVVYGDDVGLLTNPTPPLSPELPSTNGVV